MLISITYAGINVTVHSQATATPSPTNRPNTCTGGMGVRASAANPAIVVSDVYSIGLNSVSITPVIVARRSFVF